MLARDLRILLRGSEKLLITGPNGAGKTTLLRLIRKALEERGGITVLNPGSIGRTAHPAYAVLTLDGARFRAELKTV